MVSRLVQLELDEAESTVLHALFGSDKNIQVSPLLNAYLRLKGIDVAAYINGHIRTFEEFMVPFMTEDGLVSGEKLAIILEGFFPGAGQLSIANFRLVDVVRKVEPMLQRIGGLIRS